jgi:predicted aldo/keto reductase-like oxidoreductase
MADTAGPRVTLGRTGITSPKNAFGALPIQRISEHDAVRLVRRAYDGGFTFFDTARAYSDSESKIGAALSDVRHHITLATKTQARTVDGFWEQLHTSLRLLKTDYVDIYQLHLAPQCYRPGDGTGLYEALCEAKKQGKVRHIGITAHLLHIAEEIVQSGLYETLQFPLSYVSSPRDIALYEASQAAGMGFIAMKALAGGLLTRADAAYAWLSEYPGALPIWGIQRESELDQFLSFFEHPPTLTPEMSALIEADKAALSGNFCRGCGYCMPCPVGIQINTCARMIQMIRRSPAPDWLTPENQAMMENITNCIRCNQCKGKCPYSLDIPNLLVENLADYRNIVAGKTRV